MVRRTSGITVADTKEFEYSRPRPATVESHQAILLITAGGVVGIDDVNSIQGLMYLRVGELSAHIGRYDMYALSLIDVLAPGGRTSRSNLPRETVESRGATIKRLMKLRSLPIEIQEDFGGIDGELQPILARHVISALSPAVIGVSGERLNQRSLRTGRRHDWFDLVANIHTDEIESVIQCIERDVLRVIALYFRVAELVLTIRERVRRDPRLLQIVH